jgi:hypothetical protein
MLASPLALDALEELLPAIIGRFGAVRDDQGTWLKSDEKVADHLGNAFTVEAGLHPGEARDAARELADNLAGLGLRILRRPPARGNSLATRLARLAADIATSAGNPGRLTALANVARALADEVQTRDDAVIPAHLRSTTVTLPAGVIKLADHRRAM